MGKRCKILIVAIMIAAIAVTGGIVSLGSANADNEILDTTRYVTVTGATVAAAQDLTAEGSSNIHKGLLISPETAGGTYSGKINGIFAQGSTTIQFSSPGTSNQATASAIYFKFVDTNDSSNYFTVEYSQNGWYTGAAVGDNEGHYRTTRYDNPKNILEKKEENGGEATNNSIVYPHIGQKDSPIGKLFLDWDNSGVLTVSTTGHDPKVKPKSTLARFDSDIYASSDGESQFYGLKKINFKNGFYVEFGIKANKTANNILLESVTTVNAEGADEAFSFENATAAAEPSWFAEYAKIPQISLGDNVIKAKYKDSFTVPEASYSFPVRGSDSAVCAKAEYSTDGGATYNETAAGEILEAAGSYKLRYTAVEGSSLPGNTAEYSFVIMDEYFDNASAVSVTGATVTAGVDSSGSVTHKGVLVASDNNATAFSGNINGIFTGNSTIQFMSPGKLNGNKTLMGDVTLTITDANDPDNYFDIIFRPNGDGWFIGKAVTYKGQLRMKHSWLDNIYDTWQKYDSYSGWFGGDDCKPFIVRLNWDGDVLEVYNYDNNQNREYAICRFDGTSAIDTSKTPLEFGMPKLTFKNGYKISFKSEVYSGRVTPILFESVVNNGTTYSFEEEIIEVSATPAWYTAYLNAPQITIDGTFESMYTTEEGVTVSTATFVTLADPAAKAVAKIEYSKDGGAFAAIPADRKLTEKGNYVIRYTAVEGSTSAGNAIERSFRIVDEYFDMANVVSTVGATVTAGADKSGSVTHKGLLIAPEAGSAPYTAKINGVFNGNSSVTFAMAGELVGSSSKDLYYVMNVFDVNDDKNGFKIYFYRQNGGWYVCAAVGYDDGNGEVYRTTRQWDGLIKSNQVDGEAYLTWFAAGDKSATKIDLSWDSDGVLAVTGYGDYAANGRILAKFDGTDAIDNDNKYFGLPKLAFTNGYRISFEALPSLNGGTEIAPLLLEEINGVSLADKVLAPEKMVLDEENCALLGNEVVTVNGTNDNKTAEELGLGARFPYSVAFGSLTVRAEKTILATVPALNEYATTPLTYTYLGKTLNQSVTVVNAAPVVTLNVAATENFRMGGPNASTLTLGAGDVTATDLVDGKEGVTVKIYVKAPLAADFTEVTDGSAFAPTETGEYIVKYVGVDKDGNASAGTTRSIVVIDGKVPVIVVDEIADSALIKSSITVPTATATDGGDETTPLDVTFKVIYKVNASDVTGEELSVAEGEKMTFDRAGTYVFVYYSIDADGNEIDKTFAVTVRPDTDRPVLTVEGGTDNVTATKGEEITVRPATAADEVDGTVTVTVKVTFGVTEVTVTDGKFVAENEGVYSVTYTASDEAGNTAEVTYSVAVSPVAAPEKKGCGKQTARDLAIMLGSLSAILAAALFVGKKG